tara:strand:+ start:103035 stop:103553 length:519 start_codon:yes stop_codon:yes gene_type:complete
MPNLPRLINKALLFVFTFSILVACKKETSNTVYELEDISALPASAGKIKLKSEEQYVAVLYANFFQKAISIDRLKQTTDAIYSVGDKQLAYEMVVSNFMNDTDINIPSDSVLTFGSEAELEEFLNETYKRFYVRPISEAEKQWFKNYLTNNKDVTVELIYAAFALSNEYQFY